MSFDFWSTILIVSSLTPIYTQFELVSNESSIVSQWTSPQQMASSKTSNPREARSQDDNGMNVIKSFFGSPDGLMSLRTKEGTDDKISSPAPPYAGVVYRGGPNVYQSGNGYAPVYTVPNMSNQGGYSGTAPVGYNAAADSGYNLRSGGYPAALGGYAATPGGYAAAPGGYVPPPAGYVAAPGGYAATPVGYVATPGGYPVAPGVYATSPGTYSAAQAHNGCYGTTSSQTPNLLITSIFDDDQCEGQNDADFISFLNIDKSIFCAKRVIAFNLLSTITCKKSEKYVVNHLQSLAPVFKQSGGLNFFEFLLFVTRGSNSLEGRFVLIKVIARDDYLLQKCSQIPGTSQIQAESATLMIADPTSELITTCLTFGNGCAEKIRSSANTVCKGRAMFF